MMKLLLTLVMMLAFGTSTVNAEENTTSIEDKISELAKTRSDNESTIKAKIDELSEEELKAVIVNVSKLEEKNLDDLAIEEAAISKLDEMNSVKKIDLVAVGIGTLGVVLMFYSWFRGLTGHSDKIMKTTLVLGVLLFIVMITMVFLIRLWVQNW